MPQMAPMNWLCLFSTASVMLLMIAQKMALMK